MRRIATIISLIFHPLFVPIYLILLLAEIEPVMSLYFSSELKWRFIISLIVTTVIGPAVSMFFLKRRGLIDDIEMSTLKGRTLMYTVTAAYYLFTYVMLKDIDLPRVIDALFIGLVVTLLLLALISIRYKISAHLAAMGGVCAVLIWVFYHYGIWQSTWLMSVLSVSAIVATCRLGLQAHRIHEVATGFILGALCLFGSLVLFV